VKFPLYIAKRYLFSLSKNSAINIITFIAATGIIVGAMSLFIVLSGFSGLKEFSLQYTNIFDSDLKIYPESGKTITFSEAAETELKHIEGIVAYSKVIEEQVLLQYEGKQQIAYIKGVDKGFEKVIPVDSILYFSEWFVPGRDEAVVGLGTAAKLTMGVRDYTALLNIIVPRPGVGQIQDPTKAFTKQRAVVSGIYAVNEELDNKYVFTDIEFARSLLHLDSTKISAIELKLSPMANEVAVVSGLRSVFTGSVVIKNRIQQNDALYKMLNTENIAVYLIFTLVLIIALFNVIGSIIMMILDKRKNIKTLHSLGSTIKEIRSVFFYQGALMTTLGGVIGILLGALVVWLQLQFSLVKITETLAYPVSLTVMNVFVVFATITVLGFIASKIAASRVREKLLD
jgi:lipoprotein-releasing system permease protein